MIAHPHPRDAELERLLRAIATGDPAAARLLEERPHLARTAAGSGATRAEEDGFYLPGIERFFYEGDTPLHVAAAAHGESLVGTLLELGADAGAGNRMGAQPLHYAAAGQPGSPRWSPQAQAATLERLLRAGADPAASDRRGVTPLHVAVRARCAAAVGVLLAHGADPSRPNGRRSTPLHLAVQDTGRSGSASPQARAQQAQIVRLLLEHGADPRARDGHSRTALERDSRGLLAAKAPESRGPRRSHEATSPD